VTRVDDVRHRGQERRRSPRFPVAVPIHVRCGDRIIDGVTVNLSLVGVYAVLDAPVEELMPVRLHMRLPVTMPDRGTVEEQDVYVDAVTVRVEPADGRYPAAFMFGKLDVEAEWVIGRYLIEQFEAVLHGGAGASQGASTHPPP